MNLGGEVRHRGPGLSAALFDGGAAGSRSVWNSSRLSTGMRTKAVGAARRDVATAAVPITGLASPPTPTAGPRVTPEAVPVRDGRVVLPERDLKRGRDVEGGRGQCRDLPLAENAQVTTVAHQCGWSSAGVFIDVFHRTFGHTPGAVRVREETHVPARHRPQQRRPGTAAGLPSVEWYARKTESGSS